jgi:transglutaminase/protease-like cytokinesis protein 3
MTTEREYREWQRRNRKKLQANRRKSSSSSILLALIALLSVGFTIKSNPDWLSLFSLANNSLKSLTQEFVTEIDEPIVYSANSNFENVNFQRIDQIAQSINYDGDSTTELAEILSVHANTDLEKARIIYSWITHHIIYDLNALDNLFQNDIYPDISSQNVLKNKATICSGYANLYQQLAEKMGLKSVIILGYAKGVDYAVGNDNRVNHAWNGVKIDGNWYLMDPTWGAGIVNEGVFIAGFNPFYFATPPQEFIYSHFPENPHWQLLDVAYSRSQFDNLPEVSADLFKHEIKLISNRSKQIYVDHRLAVTLQAPSNIMAIANINVEGKPIQGNYTLVQRQGENIIVNATFPQKGNYQLDIFAKPKNQNSNNLFPLIVSYDVSVNSSSQQMPKTFANFYENNAYLESPLQADLINGQNTYFRIKVDNATDVQIMDQVTNKWQKLDRYGSNIFAGNINAGSGNLTVFAKFDHGSRYWALLEYK